MPRRRGGDAGHRGAARVPASRVHRLRSPEPGNLTGLRFRWSPRRYDAGPADKTKTGRGARKAPRSRVFERPAARSYLSQIVAMTPRTVAQTPFVPSTPPSAKSAVHADCAANASERHGPHEVRRARVREEARIEVGSGWYRSPRRKRSRRTARRARGPTRSCTRVARRVAMQPAVFGNATALPSKGCRGPRRQVPCPASGAVWSNMQAWCRGRSRRRVRSSARRVDAGAGASFPQRGDVGAAGFRRLVDRRVGRRRGAAVGQRGDVAVRVRVDRRVRGRALVPPSFPPLDDPLLEPAARPARRSAAAPARGAAARPARRSAARPAGRRAARRGARAVAPAVARFTAAAAAAALGDGEDA